jgi:hypothetical protein
VFAGVKEGRQSTEHELGTYPAGSLRQADGIPGYYCILQPKEAQFAWMLRVQQHRGDSNMHTVSCRAHNHNTYSACHLSGASCISVYRGSLPERHCGGERISVCEVPRESIRKSKLLTEHANFSVQVATPTIFTLCTDKWDCVINACACALASTCVRIYVCVPVYVCECVRVYVHVCLCRNKHSFQSHKQQICLASPLGRAVGIAGDVGPLHEKARCCAVRSLPHARSSAYFACSRRRTDGVICDYCALQDQ